MVDALCAHIARKQRGDRLILNNLDFQAAAGEFVAVVGPSGCGKSTLLRILAGLDEDFQGHVHRSGTVGMVFQDPSLLPWCTVLTNIALAAPQLSRSAVLSQLQRVGLDGTHDLYPRQLSVGMARRVALVRALAVRPDILLLDEPLVSLDHDNVVTLRRLLLETWEQDHPTIIMVTHDRAEAESMAQRVVDIGLPPKPDWGDAPSPL